MKKDAETKTRIAQQYYDQPTGMVYELRDGANTLVLRASQSADAVTQWRFSAHPLHAERLVVIGEWGNTRAHAFRAVRDLWLSRASSLGLAHFNWDEVGAALEKVRAL